MNQSAPLGNSPLMHDLQPGIAPMQNQNLEPPTKPVGTGKASFGQVKEAMALFGGMFDNLNDAICILDKQLRVHFWNTAAESLSGLPAKSVLGQRWSGNMVQNTNVVLDQGDRRNSLMAQSLTNGESLQERGYLRRGDGRWIPIDSRAVPIFGHDKTIIGVVGVFRDVSQELSLRTENADLKKQSLTDPLTQVANRAAFDDLIKRQIEARKESGQICSLIMSDLDYFKSVNDTYGHTAGDKVLRVFANVLKQCCRPEDVIARYGGEEFGVILPNCDTQTAIERAEKIRHQLQTVAWPEFPDRQITTSLGVAELEDEDTELSFIGRADEALYQSKHKGRNRTEVANGLHTHAGVPSSGPPAELEHVCTWLVLPSGEMIALKLRGFLTELDGRMIEVTESYIRVRIGRTKIFSLRPSPLPMELAITLGRTHITSLTHVRIVLRAVNPRAKRALFDSRCDEILKSLRSFLMADDVDSVL